jgi:LysM repeat protein
MALRFRFCALVLAGLAAAASAADRPPTALHVVGDHWTAWDPPTSQPTDAKIHVVVKGDTLWALAQQYLGNPYLWPQIWEKNQYVKDAHWIYPGDPIVVGIEVAPASQAIAEATPPPAPGAKSAAEEESAAGPRATSAAVRRNTPIPLGSERDIVCTGYIGDEEEELPWGISGSEYDGLVPRAESLRKWKIGKGLFGKLETLKYELSVGDVVYLDSGRAAGLSPGMVLTVVEPREIVRHPDTNKKVGRFDAYLGRVRVLTALEDRSIGEIVQSCSGIHVGDRLKTFEPEPIPLARRPQGRPYNMPSESDLEAAPTIVLADSSLYTLGEDHVVFIDRGESDDVYPGDLFTIYRVTQNGIPAIAVGELAVLSVHPRSAVAKILESRYPIYVGDRLERR